MTTVSQEAREPGVTQADRDALEAIDDALGFLMDNEREIVLAALARHRQQAERDVIARMEVVGWLYKKQGEEPQITTIRWRDIVDGKFVFGSGDWTETPLYALPPAPEAGQ